MHNIPQPLLDIFQTPSTTNSHFISFEGIEGAGKSTHINAVKEFLESHGRRVILLREPGGTTFGENLRSAILNSKEGLNPIAEAHLFAAARAQLLHQIILPELITHKTVVICDRYIDSSLAYQGSARGLGFQTILEIHKENPLNIFPHRTYYIKISLETSFARQANRGNNRDYFEKENKDFYQKLIRGYDTASEIFQKRIKIIDGEGTPTEVLKIILDDLKNLIGV